MEKFAGQKILIVDDNKTYGRLVSILLNKQGYMVKILESVMEAKDLLSKEDFALIISDLVMPDDDGVDFLAYLKQNPKTSEVPVIIVSGYDTQEHVEGLKALGAFDVLTKSFKDTNFLSTVERALNS